MTREKEKREAARKYATHGIDTDETDFYGNYVKKEDFVLPEFNAFLGGCKWSDENPKCPWISVKDRMPYFNKELLLEKFNCTKKFLTRDDENNFYIQRMWKLNGFWEWEYPANITHWFVIPELPKEQGIKL